MTTDTTLTPEEEASLRSYASAHAHNPSVAAHYSWAAGMGQRILSVFALLAADLVEGLGGMVARYGDFAPGKPFLFPPDHHINLARDLLSRARALGIGGEKESSEAQVREMRSEEWPHD